MGRGHFALSFCDIFNGGEIYVIISFFILYRSCAISFITSHRRPNGLHLFGGIIVFLRTLSYPSSTEELRRSRSRRCPSETSSRPSKSLQHVATIIPTFQDLSTASPGRVNPELLFRNPPLRINPLYRQVLILTLPASCRNKR